MRGILRLIEGLLNNDPTAYFVLGFTVAGTIIILIIVGIIRKQRERNSK